MPKGVPSYLPFNQNNEKAAIHLHENRNLGGSLQFSNCNLLFHHQPLPLNCLGFANRFSNHQPRNVHVICKSQILTRVIAQGEEVLKGSQWPGQDLKVMRNREQRGLQLPWSLKQTELQCHRKNHQLLHHFFKGQNFCRWTGRAADCRCV